MKYFYGKGKRRRYFEGWYLKQQNGTDTVALIPAFHADEQGGASASLQVITDREVFHVDFPLSSFRAGRKKFFIRLGGCVFSQHGCRLDVSTEDLCLQGTLLFGPLTPPAYDIMGPFRFVPFMECRHSVFSICHSVDGELLLNGRRFLFEKGSGYMEGDRGVSFPGRYIWTQCNWEGNSVMLSVADIPFGCSGFTGCIGFVFFNGKEHRIATYLGVKLAQISPEAVLAVQGKLSLKIELLEDRAHPLRAPRAGNMIRTVHESASCRVRYTCRAGEELLFNFISEQASFENCWTGASQPAKVLSP